MNVLTSILLMCAAGMTLAWLVAAQRRLVARTARRFVALPRLQQVLVVFAVCILTVCAQKSGSNVVFNAEITEEGRRGEKITELSNNRIIESAEAEASSSAFNAEILEKGRRGEEVAAVERRSGVSPLRNKEVNVLSRSGGTPLLRSGEISATSSASVLAPACAPFGFAYGEGSLRNASRFCGACAKISLTSLSSNPCESVQSVADSQSVESVKFVAKNIFVKSHIGINL